jgi:hypothetical protein
VAVPLLPWASLAHIKVENENSGGDSFPPGELSKKKNVSVAIDMSEGSG